MPRVTWEPVVRLHATSSAVADPATLRPGADLVLTTPVSHGLALGAGVLVDDWTDAPERAAIDAEAIDRLARWRAGTASELTVDGVDLTHIHETELLAWVALPAVRVARSLMAAFASGGPGAVSIQGLSSDQQECVVGLLAASGIGISASSAAPSAHPGFPREPRRSRAVETLRATGIPSRVRGGAVLLPYWHLAPVAARLASGGEPGLVLDPSVLPGIGRQLLGRAARRGGWLAYPGWRARRRSRALVSRALERRSHDLPTDPIDRLIDRGARRLLAERGLETPAMVRRAQGTFAGGRVPVLVLPFDSAPVARMLIAAARGTRVRTLLVQHGFHSEPNDPDKQLVDVIAAWSVEDAEHLRATTPAEQVVLTGNPGTVDLAHHPASEKRTGRDTTLVLIQDLSPSSARSDPRIALRHGQAALHALQRARPGTRALLRPHPGEPHPGAFAALAAEAPDLDVVLDIGRPIEQLIDDADLCIGAVSTATLQAGVAGVPVAFLNLDRVGRQWPFDGATLPTAYDSDELAQRILEVLAAPAVAGGDAMRRALGARTEALDAVMALIGRLASEPPTHR
jgi:hypothetical protein